MVIITDTDTDVLNHRQKYTLQKLQTASIYFKNLTNITKNKQTQI